MDWILKNLLSQACSGYRFSCQITETTPQGYRPPREAKAHVVDLRSRKYSSFLAPISRFMLISSLSLCRARGGAVKRTPTRHEERGPAALSHRESMIRVVEDHLDEGGARPRAGSFLQGCPIATGSAIWIARGTVAHSEGRKYAARRDTSVSLAAATRTASWAGRGAHMEELGLLLLPSGGQYIAEDEADRCQQRRREPRGGEKKGARVEGSVLAARARQPRGMPLKKFDFPVPFLPTAQGGRR